MGSWACWHWFGHEYRRNICNSSDVKLLMYVVLSVDEDGNDFYMLDGQGGSPKKHDTKKDAVDFLNEIVNGENSLEEWEEEGVFIERVQ